MPRKNSRGIEQRAAALLTSVVSAALLLGLGATNSCTQFEIEVLSSPPDLVSGGDARVAVAVPLVVAPHQVSISLNGEDVTDAFALIPDTRILEGVVSGLEPGDNLLEVTSNGLGLVRPAVELVLTDYDIAGPMFSGPQQQPFLCASAGHRAHAELGPAIDANCAVETVVSFKYKTTGGVWGDYDPAAPPADLAQTTTMDGETVDYIVRWERGTINRFIYSIAVLSPNAQDPATPDLSAWNQRLIYYFQGGVAIGHYQGDPSRDRMLFDYGLSRGYAVAYSTGTKTGTHYNLELGGETAIMVKDRFVSAYGNPVYTVGVGGSGGGIQQYVYAQNHKGLIDAGIPQYSYPDMITQTIHIGDCELLERWIDMRILSTGDPKWLDWRNRTRIEGLNASNTVGNPYGPFTPFLPPGSSECINGWRGLSPLVLNPHFGTAPGISLPDQLGTEWTHFGDAINVYGVAADGYAANTWDNVGVQYGLEALKSGFLSPDEFLDLNAEVGSWKNEPDMIQEGCPFFSPACYSDIDVWSARNMSLSPDGGVTPAARKEADPNAVEAAYNVGLVNHGDVQIPLIDWRNYLEAELNMHNSHQSFASRQRLLDYDGDASNQVIWFTDQGLFDQTPMAFEVIEAWMTNIREHPWKSVAENKPAAAVDSCFDVNGDLIYAGDDAWAGILDDEPPGPCTTALPIHSTSRIIAGGPITGDVFKCHLIPVDDAVAQGFYGGITFDAAQKARLDGIFPTGVCDYAQGDARRP